MLRNLSNGKNAAQFIFMLMSRVVKRREKIDTSTEMQLIK